MDKVINLKREEALYSKVEVDKGTRILENYFDFKFEGVSSFKKITKPKEIPSSYNIGLIIGASGSGKTTLLKEFGEEKKISWDNTKAIISNFEDIEDGVNRLMSVGLGSVPSWGKPYSVLSNGEKFRANLSRQIQNGAIIDEFTSVVDRNVAKATSNSISKFIRDNNIKNVVFSSCHKDIIEWLNPDWVIDTDEEIFYIRGSLRKRPDMQIKLIETKYSSWRMFARHHYLIENINRASKCYLILWEGKIVGFTSILPSPNGYIKNAYREHRTVILPDYQGLGIATSAIDALAKNMIERGYRFYSRTAHIRLGRHRNNNNRWIATSTNKRQRTQKEKEKNFWDIDTNRVCFSHEYVGEDYSTKEHLNIQINISDIKQLTYEDVKKILLKEKEENKNKFIVLFSGIVGVNTIVDKVAMELGIRREMNLPSKIKKNKIHKVINI